MKDYDFYKKQIDAVIHDTLASDPYSKKILVVVEKIPTIYLARLRKYLQDKGWTVTDMTDMQEAKWLLSAM